jgi:hypothetical protein
MPPKFRKRPREEEEEDVLKEDITTNNSSTIRSKLQQVREDQKFRERGAGVNANTLSLGNIKQGEEEEEDTIELLQKSTTTIIPLETKSPHSRSNELLNLSSFEKSTVGALSTNRSKSGEELEDPKMVAFVEERLRLLREQERSSITTITDRIPTIHSTNIVSSLDKKVLQQQQGIYSTVIDNLDDGNNLKGIETTLQTNRIAEEVAEAEAEAYLQNPSKLYEIPNHLHVSSITGFKKRNDADVGAGGVMLGGTGIAEIALPESEKNRIKQETIQAVNKLMTEKSIAEETRRKVREGELGIGISGGGGSDRGLNGGLINYGSISSNFDQHRREWITNERASGHGHSGNYNTSKGVKMGKASDDKAFSLYKKREREGMSNK